MKERPILFSGPMVRAILEGRKTQTRRIVKLPHTNPLGVWEPTTIGGENGGRTAGGETVPLQGAIWHTRTGDCLTSPHGQPGDRLWVRETWKTRTSHSCALDTCDCADVWVDYQAAGDGVYFPERKIDENWTMPEAALKGQWVPSIHMPRWASRITLEITGVRVERLQSISESDAESEGAIYGPLLPMGWNKSNCMSDDACMRSRFAALWDRLNATRGHGWDVNPWVWTIEFRRIER
ncbi:hypothetical protein [Burkholderia vietnamiensis]|uniref:hypothetical protein n=1 Tax=Burkholderia vietnamiensis TaxID=60552 RepID=UPI001593766D